MTAASPSSSARRLVVVAGSGRSGTSLFTGLAGRLGLYIPKPEVAANKSNPRGFSEPRWAVDFNEALLKQTSVNIDDGRPEAWDITTALAEDDQVRGELAGWLAEQFEESDRIIVKDPRLAWFLQLYRAASAELDAEVNVVSMVRHPAEVLKSRELAYGKGLSATARAAGWLNVMLTIEKLTRHDRRAVVRYDALLDEWRPIMQRADDAMDLQLFARATPEQVADADGLVDTSLRRSLSSLDEMGLPPRLAELATRAFDTLSELADEAGAESEGTRKRLDDLHEEYDAYFEESVSVAQSAIGAARREARANTARRIRKEIAEQQAEQAPHNGALSLAQRAVRRLRGG